MAIQAIQSETSACRDEVVQYCQGTGLDLGSAGDPVVPWAIQIDLEEPYQTSGASPIHIEGDASNLKWFRDGVFDFVYSSHLLEDFADWPAVVEEWARVVKPGGYMVIIVPDRERFRAAVAAGQGDNLAHQHEFSVGELTTVAIERLIGWSVIRDSHFCDDSYSIIFVARRVK